MRKSRRPYWIGLSASWVIRAFGATWRVRNAGAFDRVHHDRIYALLHGQMLLPSFAFRRVRPVILISRHGDGEMIAQAIERLGYHTVRGSSTRGGGQAAQELIESWADRPWVITPDGPKGPRGSVKEGLIRLAADSGRAIQPICSAASSCKQFSSWDRFVLPLPFSRIAVHFGEPLVVPRDTPASARTAMAQDLESRLRAGEEEAVRELQNW